MKLLNLLKLIITRTQGITRYNLLWKLALVLGVIGSVCRFWRDADARLFLMSGMYRTASSVLAGYVCTSVLLALGIMVAGILIVLASRVVGARGRLIFATVALLGMFAYLGVFAVRVTGTGVDMNRDWSAGAYWLNLVLAGAIVVIGLFILILRKFSARQASDPEAISLSQSISRRVHSLGKAFVPVVCGVSRLWIPSLVIVIVLHIMLLSYNILARQFVRNRPNIIWIMSDTLRADHMSAYGYNRNTTPNLDKFASSSVFFKRAIAQAALTRESVPSFRSGRYLASLQPKTTVFAESQLHDVGYSTGAVISNDNARLGDSMGDLPLKFEWTDFKPCDIKPSSAQVVDSALKRIDSLGNQKFMMFMLFMDAHSPYLKNKGYDFDPDYKGINPTKVTIDLKAVAPKPLPEPYVKHLAALYDSDVAYMDHQIGRLFAELKKRGLYDNSIIIFLGDHGEELHDHGALFHGHTTYEELLHVPLMVKLPGQTVGRQVSGTMALVDLYPSLLEYLNMPVPSYIQGRTFDLNTIKSIPDAYVLSAAQWKQKSYLSVTSQQYKYMYLRSTKKELLFDILRDPKEQHDLSRSDKAVRVAMKDELMSRLSRIGFDQNTTVSAVYGERKISDEDRNKLRSLGYMQ